jgi:hypothetical protein
MKWTEKEPTETGLYWACIMPKKFITPVFIDVEYVDGLKHTSYKWIEDGHPVPKFTPGYKVLWQKAILPEPPDTTLREPLTT